MDDRLVTRKTGHYPPETHEYDDERNDLAIVSRMPYNPTFDTIPSIQDDLVLAVIGTATVPV